MSKYLYVMAGGAAGCLLRYIAILLVSSRSSGVFPFGTFFVNLTGSLLIGLLFGFFSVHGDIEDRVKFLLFIGFLGGFTTFSSFAFENMKLISTGMMGISLLYIVLSNVIGIALVFGGYYAGLKLK